MPDRPLAASRRRTPPTAQQASPKRASTGRARLFPARCTTLTASRDGTNELSAELEHVLYAWFGPLNVTRSVPWATADPVTLSFQGS